MIISSPCVCSDWCALLICMPPAACRLLQDLLSLTPLLSEWMDPATGAMDESFAQALLNFDPAANYFSFEWNRQPASVQEAREIQQNMARGQTDSGGWNAHAAAAQLRVRGEPS